MMRFGYAAYGLRHGLDFAGPVAGLLLLIALAALVVIVVYASRHGRMTHSVTAAPTAPAAVLDGAIQIARERLARGEIDPEQYDRIVSSLTGTPIAHS